MALSLRDKQILLYGGDMEVGYIGAGFKDADPEDFDNLKEDFLEAAKTMDEEIEAGNFITVDKQFVMNNVGMFRGIHNERRRPSKVVPEQVYVFNFEFEDSQSFDETNDVSLVFFLDTPAQALSQAIGVGLEPLRSFTHQYSDDWQFVPSLKDWGNPVLNWTPQQLIQMIEKFTRS